MQASVSNNESIKIDVAVALRVVGATQTYTVPVGSYLDVSRYYAESNSGFGTTITAVISSVYIINISITSGNSAFTGSLKLPAGTLVTVSNSAGGVAEIAGVLFSNSP